MTHTTMKRSYQPDRSPLFGIAAVLATTMTIGIAVLLPMHHVPTQPQAVAIAAAPASSADIDAPMQVVKLPAIEITASRPTKSAANSWWNMPAVFKQKS